MSLVPRGWKPAKQNPDYSVTYTLKDSGVRNAKALVEKTAQSFEDKFGSGSITVDIGEPGESFTVTSKNKEELNELPKTFGVGKFVRGAVKGENDDDRTWQEHARDHRL